MAPALLETTTALLVSLRQQIEHSRTPALQTPPHRRSFKLPPPRLFPLLSPPAFYKTPASCQSSLPSFSNDGSPLSEVTAFCDKHKIPAEGRPQWLENSGVVQIRIPSSTPIESLMSSLAQFRSTGNSISMETRSAGKETTIKLTISPFSRSSGEHSASVIEATVSGVDDPCLIQLRKPVGRVTKEDISTIELALYLGYVKPPSREHSQVSLFSRKLPTPPLGTDRWIDSWESQTNDYDDAEMIDPFLSSLFGPSLFNLFGSLNSEEVPSLRGHQMGHQNIQQVSPDQRIKQQLEKMGALVYLPDDARDEFNWNDLAGYEEAKRTIEETLLLGLAHPDVFDKITKATRSKSNQSNRPRMILFNGPPGTGKTSTARIIASQVKLPLIYVSLEAIVSKWFGESEKNLGQIFDQARLLGQTHDGCIVFVDEIDSLASSRDDLNSHEASRRILSILLRRLDGFDTQKDKTVLICATNRERDLDEAFRSRIDVSVMFPLPDHEARKKIIHNYAKHLNDEDVEIIATHCGNLSGRNIKDLCQIAERKWVAIFLREARRDVDISAPPASLYVQAAVEKQTQQA